MMINGDAEALRQLLLAGGGNRAHELSHYLYFAKRPAAEAVAEELRQVGFSVEHRRGADGTSWLVLAKRVAVPDAKLIAQDRALMEGYAASYSGEYDGWEANIADVEPT